MLDDGRLELRPKRPWRDGTTAFVFQPRELIERLVAVVPRPRAHLIRYSGVLAPSLSRLTFWAGGPNGRNGPDARDYPGAVEATVSDDCVTFGPVVARGTEPQPGCQDDGKPCDQPFAIDFPAGTSARCVRLTLTKVLKLGGGIWWAIDELSVYP